MAGALSDAEIRHRHEDLRISWTALQRWETCRQMEHLHKSGKRVPSTDGRIFLPGTVADLTMRRWLEGEDHAPGTLALGVDAVLEEKTADPERPIKWRGSEKGDRAAIAADVKAGMERLEPWLREHVLPYEYEPEARDIGVVGIPHPDGTLHRVELTVAVDIAVRRQREDGTYAYRLHDLKFTKDETYVRGKTLGQLTFYRLGWAAMLGISTNDIEYLSFVTPATPILETPVYPKIEDMRVMVSRITGYAQGMWSGKYPTKEKDSFCTYRCDVRQACPLFALPVTRGKITFESVLEARAEREWRSSGE